MNPVWLALAVSVVWGIEPLFFRTALAEFTPESVVWLRFAGALPFFLIFAKSRETLNRSALVGGVFLAMNYLGFLKGIALAGPAGATVLLQSGSFIFVGISVLTGESRLSGTQRLALLITLAGYVCYFSDVARSASVNPQTLTGYAWVLLSAMSWAVYATLTRRAAASASPHWLTAQSFFIALLVLSCVSTPFEFRMATVQQTALLAVIVCLTIVAYTCLGLALRRGKAAVVAPIIATNPLITLLALTLEAQFASGTGVSPPLTVWGTIGVLLVVAGVGLVSKKQ